MLLEYFRKHVLGPVSPPTKRFRFRPGRGLWRSTRLVFGLALLSAWSSLLSLRLLSRKWIADHILCHKQPRKPLDSWQCEQDKRVFGYLVFNFSKLFFSEREKLQTSLYHPIPLDSKPYKQTNRLENLFLFEVHYCFFVFFVSFSCFFFGGKNIAILFIRFSSTAGIQL